MAFSAHRKRQDSAQVRRFFPGLAGWLAIVTTVLVSAAVAGVSIAGLRLLHDLAAAEALTRVELGVASARETLRQEHEELHTAANLLAVRPTLERLLAAADERQLDAYLRQYCSDAALDACAILRNSGIVSSTPGPIPWPAVNASAAAQGDRFLASGGPANVLLLGAWAAIPGHDSTIVIAVNELGEEQAARLSERTGLETIVVGAPPETVSEPFSELLDLVTQRDRPVARRIGRIGGYGAALPIKLTTGETAAYLVTVLPEAGVKSPVAALERRMILVALVVALLATSGGVLIGRHWIHGVRRLTEAARRIGAGDLGAAVPTESGAEINVLARTMEDMRKNLLELTEEIRRREAQAQAVLGGIIEGVFAVDRKRRIRFLNAQAQRLLSTSGDDAFGRFCGDVLRPLPGADGRRPCDHDCPIIRARSESPAESVERIAPGSGAVRRVVIASAAAGDGIQVQVLRDETELEAARRTRDTVLANISHEFRTPLAAQLASIELLRDGIGDMSEQAQRQLVSSLERGLQRLTLLIDNLLESVRIESGQLAIRRHDLCVTDVVSAARDLVEPLILQRGQHLEITPLDGLPAVRGDRERLTQVIVNLLANASKFAPQNTTISVAGDVADDGLVRVWVEDDGPGPAGGPDALLFEPFRRSTGADPEESGLGLGLFIVKSIVERHGGRVQLSRTADNRTRATIELPESEAA